eukprot:2590493-Karenia_brevis.AAC.1
MDVALLMDLLATAVHQDERSLTSQIDSTTRYAHTLVNGAQQMIRGRWYLQSLKIVWSMRVSA